MGVVERMGRGTGCAVSLYPLTLPITMREHIRASIARGYIHSDWVRKQIGQEIVVDNLRWPAESGDAALAYQGNSVGPARREIEVVKNGDDDPALFRLAPRLVQQQRLMVKIEAGCRLVEQQHHRGVYRLLHVTPLTCGETMT